MTRLTARLGSWSGNGRNKKRVFAYINCQKKTDNMRNKMAIFPPKISIRYRPHSNHLICFHLHSKVQNIRSKAYTFAFWRNENNCHSYTDRENGNYAGYTLSAYTTSYFSTKQSKRVSQILIHVSK